MVAVAVQPFAPISGSHKLRTYVVLTAKSSRARLASFSDDGYSTASSSPASSPVTSPLRAARKTLTQEPPIPDECLAYESYAAVASRFQTSPSASPMRDLRWSDISRLALSPSSSSINSHNGKPLSQKARRRQLQRARSSSGGAPNDHLECHALELSFEFLGLADLQRAAGVCTAFRDVVTSSGGLLVALYARHWRVATDSKRMPRAFATLAFAPALAMVQTRRADFKYALSTRSLVTTRADATLEIVNNSLLRVLTRGAVDSVRGVDALPVQPCAHALAKLVSYYEVTMSGCGSVGVVSLSDPATRRAYGYGSDEHVGWKGVSCAYHGNDGDFVFNNGAAPYGGEWAPYGPSWGVRNSEATKPSKPDHAKATAVATPPSIVGCGLDGATRRVFFTLNGTFLGFAPFSLPEGAYAAAVSLHEFNDRAVLNAGSAPFRFDLEGFCASL